MKQKSKSKIKAQAMKTANKTLLFIVSILFFISFVRVSLADPPPPPPPGGHGQSGNQTPAGAPIDGGLGILLAMGAAYGGKKLYQARKSSKEKEKAK